MTNRWIGILVEPGPMEEGEPMTYRSISSSRIDLLCGTLTLGTHRSGYIVNVLGEINLRTCPRTWANANGDC